MMRLLFVMASFLLLIGCGGDEDMTREEQDRTIPFMRVDRTHTDNNWESPISITVTKEVPHN